MTTANAVDKAIGTNLKHRRLLGFAGEVTAERARMSTDALARIEDGSLRASADQLKTLSCVLDMSTNAVVEAAVQQGGSRPIVQFPVRADEGCDRLGRRGRVSHGRSERTRAGA